MPKLPPYIKKKIDELMPKRMAGLTIVCQVGQNKKYVLCKLEQIGNEISLYEAPFSTDSLEELENKLEKHIPLAVNIVGNQVLTREIDAETDGDALHEILPNARIQDFYLFKSAAEDEDEKRFLHVIRKESFDEELEFLRNKNYFILQSSIGYSSIASIKGLGILHEDKLEFSGMEMYFQSNSAYSLVPKEGESQKLSRIGQDDLSGDELLSYAVAFTGLVGIETGGYLGDEPEESADEFKYFSWIRNARYPALALFLIILLVNFMFFNSYNSRSEQLVGQIGINKAMVVKLDSLKSDLEAKMQILNSSGLGNLQISHLLDRMAMLLPSKINLNKIEINPLEEKMKQGDQLLFERVILVEGETTNSRYLNNWVDKLETEEWLQEVEVVNYDVGSEGDKAEFKIRIRYR